MPLFGFLIITKIDVFLIANAQSYYAILGLLIINSLAPVALILIMAKTKIVSNIDLSNQKERTVPLLFVLFFYVFCYVLIQSKHLPISNLIYSSFLGIILILLVGLIINFKWKISLHMLGIGGTLGLTYGISQVHSIDIFTIFITGLIIAGITASSRLFLKAHTSAQVYIGFIVGFLVQYLLIVNKLFISIY